MWYAGIYMPRSNSYDEKRRIWNIKQELDRQHEERKKYFIAKYNKQKMSQRGQRDQRTSSRHRESRSHSRSSSSRSRSTVIHLSPSQISDLSESIVQRLARGHRSSRSQTKTGSSELERTKHKSSRKSDSSRDHKDDRRSGRTDYEHSKNKQRSSRDQRDRPSTSQPPDREPNHHREPSCPRDLGHHGNDRGRSESGRVSEQPNLPIQDIPPDSSRDPKRCDRCKQYHSGSRNNPCTTRPVDPYESRREGSYHPHRGNGGGFIRRREYPRPYLRPDFHTRFPAPAPVPYPHPYWLYRPPAPDVHLGEFWPPQRPHPSPIYRGPYAPYGPGPSYHGYQ